CDDHFVAWVNGRRVAAGDSWVEPARVDIKDALQVGHNVIAVEALNDTGPAGLLLQLSVQLPDGKQQVVVSDASWRFAPTETEGWRTSAFDDGHWAAAADLGALGVAPWGNQGKVKALFAPDERDKTAPVPHWIWAGERGFNNGQNVALASAGSKAT